MGNLKLAVIPPLERAKRHVQFHHHGASGWVAIAKKDQNGAWRQYHYRPEELATELSNGLVRTFISARIPFISPSGESRISGNCGRFTLMWTAMS
jgi:hypothetical protein